MAIADISAGEEVRKVYDELENGDAITVVDCHLWRTLLRLASGNRNVWEEWQRRLLMDFENAWLSSFYLSIYRS